MGLDMWLSINKGATKRGERGVPEFDRDIREFASLDDWMNACEKYREKVHLAVWRKASGILNWFDHNLESVKNQEQLKEPVREGVQNYVVYPVTKAEYDKLLEDCIKVWNSKDVPEDMMPVSGFFFGPRLADEGYWEDVKYTIEALTKKKDTIDWNNDKVYFHISY